jgi:hypothetical protein
MSEVQTIKDLYDRLWKGPFDQDLNLDQQDLYLLAGIDSENLPELSEHCCDYCFGALIILTCGEHDFVEFVEYTYSFADIDVFKWLIDYEGNMTDAGNPLHTYILSLNKTIDIIETYYGGKYRLIYELRSYSEYETYADYIIATDGKGGYEKILDALKGKEYTAEQFDPQVLYDIWEQDG